MYISFHLSNNYKILGSDLGKNIKVVVKFSDSFGFSETVSSNEVKIDLGYILLNV